jgi:hypothetical protein
VGPVTLSVNALIPILLSSRVHLPTEIASSHIAGDFGYFHMAKGHLTGAGMGYSVETNLPPYGGAYKCGFASKCIPPKT